MVYSGLSENRKYDQQQGVFLLMKPFLREYFVYCKKKGAQQAENACCLGMLAVFRQTLVPEPPYNRLYLFLLTFYGKPTSGNCVGRASLRYAVSPQAACNARTHAEPSFLNTTSTVFSRILMSIPIFQFSIYSLSSLTTSSKSVILLRPLTCHIPVIPGLIASLAWW